MSKWRLEAYFSARTVPAGGVAYGWASVRPDLSGPLAFRDGGGVLPGCDDVTYAAWLGLGKALSDARNAGTAAGVGLLIVRGESAEVLDAMSQGDAPPPYAALCRRCLELVGQIVPDDDAGRVDYGPIATEANLLARLACDFAVTAATPARVPLLTLKRATA